MFAFKIRLFLAKKQRRPNIWTIPKYLLFITDCYISNYFKKKHVKIFDKNTDNKILIMSKVFFLIKELVLKSLNYMHFSLKQILFYFIKNLNMKQKYRKNFMA